MRRQVRDFALGLPGAVEEFPWGQPVVKVDRRVFVFLGRGPFGAGAVSEPSAGPAAEPPFRDASGGGPPPRITVKLADAQVRAHALSAPGAAPAGYGLGRSGWVGVPLGAAYGPKGDLLREWVEESYRTIAPARLVAELDAG